MKYKLDRAALGALVNERAEVDRLAGQRLAIMYDAADGSIWSDLLNGDECRIYNSESIVNIGVVYEQHRPQYYISMLELALAYKLNAVVEPGWRERWGIEV